MRRLNGSVGSGDGYAKIHASLAGCDDSFLILLKYIYAKIHASLAGSGAEKEENNYIKWS